MVSSSNKDNIIPFKKLELLNIVRVPILFNNKRLDLYTVVLFEELEAFHPESIMHSHTGGGKPITTAVLGQTEGNVAANPHQWPLWQTKHSFTHQCLWHWRWGTWSVKWGLNLQHSGYRMSRSISWATVATEIKSIQTHFWVKVNISDLKIKYLISPTTWVVIASDI